MFIPRPHATRRAALTLVLLSMLPLLPACWSTGRKIPPRLTGADIPASAFLAHLDRGDLASVTVYGDGTLVAAPRPGHPLQPSGPLRTRVTLDIPTWNHLIQSGQSTQTPVIFEQEQ